MHEYNLERIKAKQKALGEQQAEERFQRERERIGSAKERFGSQGIRA